MYADIRSVYVNYDNFRRPVGGVIKLSSACFGCFEGTFPLAQLNNCNFSGKNNHAFPDIQGAQSNIFRIIVIS